MPFKEVFIKFEHNFPKIPPIEYSDSFISVYVILTLLYSECLVFLTLLCEDTC